MDTTADLINRDITPFTQSGAQIYKQLFAASSDPNNQEISRRLIIAKDFDEYKDMLHKVTSTGLFADLRTLPYTWVVPEEKFKYWYRSSDTIGGVNPYVGHLTNKKWPLKKVF